MPAPLDLTSVKDGQGKKKTGPSSNRPASNRPEKKAEKKSKDSSSGKKAESPAPSHRQPSPRADGKGGGGKKTGKKKNSDRKETASPPPLTEPEPMVAKRPLVLRKTVELNSDKLGEVPSGTSLLLVESRDGDSGAKRALIRYTPAGSTEPSEGWVTSVLKDGTENLGPPPPPPPVAASAAAVPVLDAAASAAAASKQPAAGAGATPRTAPLRATPRAVAPIGATPRGAPTATPRGGKAGMTPRQGPGGKEVLAPVRQAPPPEVVLGGPQGYLAQPEEVRAPKKDGSPTTCVAIVPPPLPGAPTPLGANEKPPPLPEPLPALPTEGLASKPEGKRPVREDGAPSRHAIPATWTPTVEPVLLFNCCNGEWRTGC